jgi:MerR family redox-sensitive transcriptional activator SoxR
MSDIDIAELARRSGLPASTLRYYEEKGLIASVGRRGLKRLFDPAVSERLALIQLGRAAGFSLDELAAMLSEAGPRIEKDRLSAKAAELDCRIGQLQRMRDGLLHAASCPAPSLMECPHFRRIVRLVGGEDTPARARRIFRAEAV